MRNALSTVAALAAVALAAACGDTDGIAIDRSGQLALSWTLLADGEEISCNDAGAESIRVIAERQSTPERFEFPFACTLRTGTTTIVPIDDYTVVVQVLDDHDFVIATSMPEVVAVREERVTVELGEFAFDFALMSGITFGVDFGAPSGFNCAGGPGGEVVDLQNIDLRMVDGAQCIPMALFVDGSLDVPDICGWFTACIGPDQPQSFVGLPPGRYELSIEGVFDRGAGLTTACFRTVVPFQLRGGDDLDLGVLLVPFDPADDPDFCGTI